MNASAITLILVGAVLILVPLVLGFEAREHYMALHTMGQAGGSFGTSAGHAFGNAAGAPRARGGRLYALICLLAGLGCLITGIVRSRNVSNPPSPMIHKPAA